MTDDELTFKQLVGRSIATHQTLINLTTEIKKLETMFRTHAHINGSVVAITSVEPAEPTKSLHELGKYNSLAEEQEPENIDYKAKWEHAVKYTKNFRASFPHYHPTLDWETGITDEWTEGTWVFHEFFKLIVGLLKEKAICKHEWLTEEGAPFKVCKHCEKQEEVKGYQETCSHLWIPMPDFEYCNKCGAERREKEPKCEHVWGIEKDPYLGKTCSKCGKVEGAIAIKKYEDERLKKALEPCEHLNKRHHAEGDLYCPDCFAWIPKEPKSISKEPCDSCIFPYPNVNINCDECRAHDYECYQSKNAWSKKACLDDTKCGGG